MTKHRVAILKVLSGHLTVTQAATTYGFSRQHLHRLLARAKTDGLDSIEPRSRRPKSNPHHTPKHIHDRIIELRRHLTATGHDAGPVTIRYLSRWMRPAVLVLCGQTYFPFCGFVNPCGFIDGQ